ncbi:endonuclease domain-containing protein [Aquipseudomonas alcaligenes]|uniref:endonuclease domain-containing protein n=1 Tax=Aquipseudomonas alcaligenes TaxID=43263 RepID=UPI00242BEDBD|nr:DUF559 domain-containing protein [Pseudomonas alcaligenes]
MPRRKSLLEPCSLEFARHLRREATDAETLLWRHLRDRQLAGHKFRRQHPLPPYVLDFYCEALRLGIELDGGQHYADEGAKHDQYRAECLLGRGIRLLRFSNREVLLELPTVLERIYLEIVSPSPLAPLPEGEGKSGR